MTTQTATLQGAMQTWADTPPELRGLVLVLLAEARAARAKGAETYLASECADVAACGERQRMAADAFDSASALLQVCAGVMR